MGLGRWRVALTASTKQMCDGAVQMIRHISTKPDTSPTRPVESPATMPNSSLDECNGNLRPY